MSMWKTKTRSTSIPKSSVSSGVNSSRIITTNVQSIRHIRYDCTNRCVEIEKKRNCFMKKKKCEKCEECLRVTSCLVSCGILDLVVQVPTTCRTRTPTRQQGNNCTTTIDM
mmetsp:Transcript_35436/g.85761  ORF Transcript_35436/g.85761 Transcript_35436/m.85761 type:complete len:111 (+) Transcript_35436:712-1044(+)